MRFPFSARHGLAGSSPRMALWCVPLALGADSAQTRAVQAPAPPAATAPLTATLPLDPAVTTGRFENGLRYILRANKQPLGRAELRLVVNAGSVLEDDDQRGLAHFVEHMAFNGTTQFPQAGVDRISAVARDALRAEHQRDAPPTTRRSTRCRSRPTARR